MAWGELIAGGAIAVGSAAVTATLTLLGQRGQRKHDRAMAADAQQHERDLAATAQQHEHVEAAAAGRRDDLRAVYPDVVAFLLREQVNMSRTKPTFGAEGERLPPLDDEAAINLQTRIYAYASETVKPAVDELLQLRRRFEYKASELDDMQQRQNRGQALAEDERPTLLYQQLDEMRREYQSNLDALRMLVRDELAS